MGDKEVVKIPTIDFCKPELKLGSPQWESTKVEVYKALEEYGCFEAIYDKVPNEIRESMFHTLEKVLRLRSKLKEFSEKPYHRYEGQIPHFEMYENILYNASLILPESVETFVNTFWPEGNPNISKVVKSFYEPLVELDEMVRSMVLESLGMKDDYVDEFLNSSTVHHLRLTHYEKATRGLPGHVDSSFLTIIKQNQPGFQVLLPKNGDDQWISATTSPNSYLVLSADSMMAWTNGRLPSTTHRVVIDENNDRFSIQLFSLPKPGYIVEAPKELVDEEHPLLFKPFDIVSYFKYLTSRTKPGGVGLKAYQET